jgi:hypothetical protein
MWDIAGNVSSSSPARNHRGDPWHLPVDDLTRNLHETLELPGEPSDYHFAIQGCSQALWKAGRKDPTHDSLIEELCWLDIRLVDACPEAASFGEKEGKHQFAAILGFNILVELHERRDRVEEALSVAELAFNNYGQCEAELKRLHRKIAIANGNKPEVFIPAKVPLQHPHGPVPTGADSGFRAHRPDGPPGAIHWYYWWNESHHKDFEDLWTVEADRIADSLADEYGFAWPWLIGRVLAANAPETFRLLEQFSARVNASSGERLHASHPESIATWGAFHAVRKRRSWREPSAATCPVCGKAFWTGDVTSWAHETFGPARYCMDCCLQSRVGNPRPTWTKDEILGSLRRFHKAFGIIPSSQEFGYTHIPYQGSPDVRDNRMSALVNMPNVQTVKDVLKENDWLGVLRMTGLVGEAWRPSRGTWCYANDGHKCRSLLEKSIDDWLSTRGIEHECEPSWPRHPELNPSGAKRADWVLKDGTYIEAAGMMEDPAYVSKIAAKRKLAEIAGIRLLVITPTDLSRLDDLILG